MSRVAAPNKSPESLTWADSRLRLGQSNVGFWTLMAVGVLAWESLLDGRWSGVGMDDLGRLRGGIYAAPTAF